MKKLGENSSNLMEIAITLLMENVRLQILWFKINYNQYINNCPEIANSALGSYNVSSLRPGTWTIRPSVDVCYNYRSPRLDALLQTACVRPSVDLCYNYRCPRFEALLQTACIRPSVDLCYNYRSPLLEALLQTACIRPSVDLCSNYRSPLLEALLQTACNIFSKHLNDNNYCVMSSFHFAAVYSRFFLF